MGRKYFFPLSWSHGKQFFILHKMGRGFHIRRLNSRPIFSTPNKPTIITLISQYNKSLWGSSLRLGSNHWAWATINLYNDEGIAQNGTSKEGIIWWLVGESRFIVVQDYLSGCLRRFLGGQDTFQVSRIGLPLPKRNVLGGDWISLLFLCVSLPKKKSSNSLYYTK